MWKCDIGNEVIGLFDLMMVVTLLILINFLVALARQQKRKWLRVTLFIVAFITLLPALIFGFRAIM